MTNAEATNIMKNNYAPTKENTLDMYKKKNIVVQSCPYLPKKLCTMDQSLEGI